MRAKMEWAAVRMVTSFLMIGLMTAAPLHAAPGMGTLFGTDASGGNLISIDTRTGTGSVVGPMGAGNVRALAIDPTTGVMYAGQGAKVYTVNPTMGAATLVGESGLGITDIGAMDFNASGTLYGAVNIVGDGATGSDHLVTIDKATGAATMIGPFGDCSSSPCTIEGIEAIAFDPAGGLLGAHSGRGAAGAAGLYPIDAATGAAFLFTPILDAFGIPPSGGVVSLQFACDGKLFGGTAAAEGGASDGGRLVTIDSFLTGVFAFVGAGSATGGTDLGALALRNPCPTLRYFLCYRGSLRRPIAVTLSDQFDSGTYEGTGAEFLCAPALDHRATTGFVDPGLVDLDTHLQGYGITGSHAKRRRLLVLTQDPERFRGRPFDLRSLFVDTLETDTVLVPTAKSVPPDPPPGPPDPGSTVDHYRCLKAKTSKGTPKFPKGVIAAVVDQFTVGFDTSVVIKRPTKLCLPADVNGSGVKNPDAGLLCYRAKLDPRERTTAADVQVNDEFGPAVVALDRVLELCVPAQTNPLCGNNAVDHRLEECDGSADAACPGFCGADCRCTPFCGDGEVNAPGEECDGSAITDTACPGSCSPDCTCPVCGDGVAEPPVEECDGRDDAACPGRCGPDCSCGQLSPVTEDLITCNPRVGDTWIFGVAAGQTVRTTGDTVDGATAADLCLFGICEGGQYFFADDSTTCSLPPPNFACPESTFVAAMTGACKITMTLCSSECADAATANYQLRVTLNSSDTTLRLAEDDVPR